MPPTTRRPDRAWENARAGALARLAAARAAGKADALAAAAVDALNLHPAWATTSSCSGRVQVLALPAPGAKAAARVLGRWHHAPAAKDLEAAVASRPPALVAHLFVEPPILHVLARDLAAARGLLRLGQGAGLKACHVRSLASAGRVAVELGDAGRIAAPVAGPVHAADAGFLALVADEAPPLLARGHGRLAALAAAAPRALQGTSPGAPPAGGPRFKGSRKEAN